MLGEFVRLQRGHDLTAAQQQPGNVPIMGSAGPNGTHNEALASGPGVVVGRSGASAGRVHFCENDYWPHNTCLYVTDFLGNNPRFAYYLLQTLDLAAFNSGSAQPSLNRNYLYTIRIERPDRAEQDGIVEILQSLDDRITILRESNATLEAIAQALFKAWFVDFEPVRAKQEGRRIIGLDEATAALFPGEFEESELGLVPRGWRIGKLEDLLLLQRGFDLPAANRTAGDFPIIAASGPSGTHKFPMAKAPGVITGRSGVLGRVFLELEDYWPLNTTLWVKDFRAATPSYAYEVLRRLDFASYNAGSAVPTLNRNHIHSLPYLVPSRACIDAFEALAMPLYRRVRENQKQADSLAGVRDALLPRLISGQLRLPEAEVLVA
jgi:type I restriction enzyme, S subunit